MTGSQVQGSPGAEKRGLCIALRVTNQVPDASTAAVLKSEVSGRDGGKGWGEGNEERRDERKKGRKPTCYSRQIRNCYHESLNLISTGCDRIVLKTDTY